MADPGLNELLKWSIENSTASPNDPSRPPYRNQGLNAEALAALLGGPTDADRMRDAMAAVVSPEVDIENKLTAFDNFEQLIEQIDNANNIEALGLWKPLIEQLEHENAEIRSYAAWSISTAVQNNVKAQERINALGAIPNLAKMAVEDSNLAARKKAILALSSGIRNHQPNFDQAMDNLPDEYNAKGCDAADMEVVDGVMEKLREASQKRG